MDQFRPGAPPYWRDQRGNRDAEIPVREGDRIERDGRRYAVLFDIDRKMMAAHAIDGDRLRALKAGELASTTKQSTISASGQLPGRDVDAIWRESRDRWASLQAQKVAFVVEWPWRGDACS
jgi:hypothetical protein